MEYGNWKSSPDILKPRTYTMYVCMYIYINDFKRGCQPRNNIVKDEKGDLVADSHSILARWRNHFSQLLNVHGVNDVGQTDIHTAEPLVGCGGTVWIKLAQDRDRWWALVNVVMNLRVP